jgi:hypothetical protein
MVKVRKEIIINRYIAFYRIGKSVKMDSVTWKVREKPYFLQQEKKKNGSSSAYSDLSK